MRSIAASATALALTVLPTVVWAGGPPGDSPEPGLWTYALIGGLPVLVAIAWQVVSERRKQAVVARNHDEG